jgi:hypothetical protein
MNERLKTLRGKLEIMGLPMQTPAPAPLEGAWRLTAAAQLALQPKTSVKSRPFRIFRAGFPWL